MNQKIGIRQESGEEKNSVINFFFSNIVLIGESTASVVNEENLCT